MTTERAPGPVSLPWRTVERHLYAQVGAGASDDDVWIGALESPELAAEACSAHNARLAAKLAKHPLA